MHPSADWLTSATAAGCFDWHPSWLAMSDRLWRLLLLRDYNTRVVLIGTMLLGIAAGLLGVYLLLRKRVLIGDAISHATLPGIALAYLWTVTSGGEKSLTTLLMGAALSGGLGGAGVLALRHVAKIREDAALGIVLSVFFGAGVALISLVQTVPGEAAGLEAFIYGKAASMTSEDGWLGGAAALIVLATVVLLSKELRILCFDSELAQSQGWPILLLDCVLIALVVVVTIVGLQAVGLILIIALLVVPAASARFWTHDLNKMLFLSALMGAVSCAVGTLLSAAFDNLPSGATIVLASCACFLFSFAFGRQRGTVWRLVRVLELRRDQEFQHLLRAVYEVLESQQTLPSLVGELKCSAPIPLSKIGTHRNWSSSKTGRLARQMSNRDLVVVGEDGTLQLTPRGILRALEIVRDHRLLERYMMVEAAAQGIEADREADYLEHGLKPEHLAELAASIPNDLGVPPPSPHALESRRERRADDDPQTEPPAH
jgi:manganese/zinc/iron transport system permease protein